MRREKQLNFIGNLFSLIFAPADATSLLLSKDKPKYASLILFTLYFVILVPVVITRSQTGVNLYPETILIASFSILTISMLCFIISEFIFLNIFGYRAKLNKITASITYALVPIIGYIITMYTVNYYLLGNFDYITFMPMQNVELSPVLKLIIPNLPYIFLLDAFFILLFAIKNVLKAPSSVAFILTVLSAFPLYGSIKLAHFITLLLIPDCDSILIQFFYAAAGA